MWPSYIYIYIYILYSYIQFYKVSIFPSRTGFCPFSTSDSDSTRPDLYICDLVCHIDRFWPLQLDIALFQLYIVLESVYMTYQVTYIQIWTCRIQILRLKQSKISSREENLDFKSIHNYVFYIRIGLYDIPGHIYTDLDMENPNLRSKMDKNQFQRGKYRHYRTIYNCI